MAKTKRSRAPVASLPHTVGGLLVEGDTRPAPHAQDSSNLEQHFAQFIKTLGEWGYSICPFDRDAPSCKLGDAYLRYDVLPDDADLEMMLRLAALHHHLKVPGTFHLPWDLIAPNPRLSAAALELTRFDPRWVQAGLQCDPISGWLCQSRFEEEDRKLTAFIRSTQFAQFLEQMLGAWRTEGPDGETLRTLHDGAVNYLIDLDRSFREHFADCCAISGRGSPLSNAFGNACQENRSLSVIARWLSPIDFLVSINPVLRRLGYGRETTRLPTDDLPGAAVVFGGDEPTRLRRSIITRLGGGGWISLVLPVRLWGSDGCADLISEIPHDPGATARRGVIANSAKGEVIETPERPTASRDPAAENQTECNDEERPQRNRATRPGTASVSVWGPLVDELPDQPIPTSNSDLAALGPRCDWFDTKQLAATARQKLGNGVDLSFRRFVAWLQSEGYSFGGFEEGPPRFDDRWAYLRYDVHGKDLLAAYVLADLHEQLQIIGSFQINWRHTRAEEAIEAYFVKLMEFDRRYVQFGLHAAPTATWYLNEKLGGDLSRQRTVMVTEEFREWLLELLAQYKCEGDDALGLREIREGTDATLANIAASFRETFGNWKSISGHGNYLTSGFIAVRAKHPEIAPLASYFFPVEYMRKYGVARFGFELEVTAFGSDRIPFPRLLTEGASEAVRRRWYRGRVAHGAGFVALLHPATWTCRHNATFFMAEAGSATDL
jgi:hypothetical protein